MFLKKEINRSMNNSFDSLKEVLNNADSILIGAGSGLSTAAGFVYTGSRFERYFHDFEEKYGFKDMYSGGFYPFESLEEFWAYWSRYIYINRYMNIPKDTYKNLYTLVKDKDYFILTTNVDHCFQKSGFHKDRLFYTQGDYGLFQCSEPCTNETYDNEEIITKMVVSQGYEINDNKELINPLGKQVLMKIPTDLIPYCPHCNKPMTMNLRADNTFVQDEGWYKAANRYQDYLLEHQDKNIVLLELGVGYNTPGIIKYSFWKYTEKWKKATYVCLNYNEAYAPIEIRKKSICLNGDIDEALKKLL